MIRTSNEQSKGFETNLGVRQGCLLSPLLFSIALDGGIKKLRKS